MDRDIQLPSGEVLPVELKYEKLEKYCFSCFSLTHDEENCPKLVLVNQRADKPLSINEQKTLYRIKVDWKR
ncbi:unnamed protein product [Arabis nemorensis]|uniref:Zinc knuckle CX2CX4HX4C domain-containing protein n=1 Tax=Arabis nemorensis TaxID=586526 RepID=A0A565CCN0_9BRAS|nr:unnamed protein product [Arabis nemorensis]